MPGAEAIRVREANLLDGDAYPPSDRDRFLELTGVGPTQFAHQNDSRRRPQLKEKGYVAMAR